MNSNFDFLKNIDNNLFNIIKDAENLYRDEYFEQCMTQTRRFGEIVCKNVLGEKRTTELTFDAMLATLKDYSKEEYEKEFINDLYMLKKCGNDSTHSSSVEKDGMKALECLKSAFEIGINYCVYFKKSSQTLLNQEFSIDTLITGKKTKTNLKIKYIEEKTKQFAKQPKPKKYKPQSSTTKSIKNKKSYTFWILVGIASAISLVLLAFIALI